MLKMEKNPAIDAQAEEGSPWKKAFSTAFFFLTSLGVLYFSWHEFLRQGFSWGLVVQVAFSLAVLSGSLMGIRNRWYEFRFGSSWPEDWWFFSRSQGQWIFRYKNKEKAVRDPKSLRKVSIENTAAGPFGADLFWKLEFDSDESLSLPVGKNLKPLQEELLRLPNFQLENFIESSLTAEPAQRVCWERQDRFS